MRRIIQILLILGFVTIGLFFGTLNDEPWSVNYFLFTTNFPGAFNLLLFFLIGLIVGALTVYLSMLIHVRKKVRQVKREQQVHVGDAKLESLRADETPQ